MAHEEKITDLQSLFAKVVSLHGQGNFVKALELARLAVSVAPDNVIILNGAATCAFALDMLGEAAEYWERAVRMQPDYADGHYNLGILHARQGDPSQAEHHYREAVRIKPDHVGAHVNLGVLLHEQKRTEEAEHWYRKALEIAPTHADLLYNMGALLAEQKRYAEAEKAYLRVIELRPDHQGAYNNLGVMYRSIKEFARSEESYRHVLALNPANGAAWRNLGLLLQDLVRFDEAEAAFLQALELDEADHDARWSLSMLLLYQGRFAEGWPLYESRYHPSVKGRTITPPTLDFPQWQGESLVGKSIVVWPEQALGDELQICRYAKTLKDMGASRVTFVCKPALRSVLGRVEGIDCLVSRELSPAIPRHDFWVLQFSLPLHCHARMDSVPAQIPYLYPDPAVVEAVKPRLPSDADFKVGICWKGSAMYLADADRSPGLDPFRVLFDLPATRFCTLLPATRQEFLVCAGEAGVDLGHEVDEATSPFEETAALISELDLIISSDTSIVHLAAALGKPVWMVLPYVSDWRWVHGLEGSPWYPNLRIFRQSHRGDWHEVFSRVRQYLAEVVGGTKPTLWPIPPFTEISPAYPDALNTPSLKLNLGSGGKNIPGWVNVDYVADCHPDVVWDLESFPWPWSDSSVDQILLSHVLEHLGQSRDVYLGIIKELYRICRDGAEIIIRVPHPRHDFYLIDPTHVRPITVDGMRMFDQSLNREWVENNFANTPLGLYLGVDLRVIHFDYVLDPVFQGRLDRGEISLQEVSELIRTHANVCQQINMVVKVVKGEKK